ncbi:MAG: CapA family protein [Muribaculaceae bacterium]|nr:CapA family protein [Muribaculaceae bacterium]
MFRTLFLSLSLLLAGCGASTAKQTDTIQNDSISENKSAQVSEITILFAGDAMQHQAQLDQAKIRGGGKYDYSQCFTMIAPDIKEADYAVINLEVPLGGGPVYRGYPCFSAPDSYAEALRDAGFDMFLTSNNHCLDSGMKAARRTLTALDSIGVDHIGTYHDAAQREKLVPFIKDIKGFKVGFLNYTYGTNGIEPRDGMEVAMIDRDRMAKEIAKTREAGAEIVVVTVHWGVEYVLRQNKNQESLAQFLLDQGTDLVIGSHPHVIQPMMVVDNEKTGKKSLVVYSLGNFISNMKTGDTRGGALVRAVIGRDQNGKPVFKEANYDTFLSAKPENNSQNFRVIPSWMPESIPASQKEHWNIFNRGAEKIFNQYNKDVPRKHK